MEKVFYFISNSDNQIHRTDESDLICKKIGDTIQILSSDGEVIDEVNSYKSIGDLMEVVNGGGNDLE